MKFGREEGCMMNFENLGPPNRTKLPLIELGKSVYRKVFEKKTTTLF